MVLHIYITGHNISVIVYWKVNEKLQSTIIDKINRYLNIIIYINDQAMIIFRNYAIFIKFDSNNLVFAW